MVNILILSHSQKLAQGLKELIQEMAQNIDIYSCGGTFDGKLGSNFEEINEKINKITENNDLVVIFDMGSSMMNALTSYEMLSDEKKKKVLLADSPMVESAIQIAVMADGGQSLEEIKKYVEETSLEKL